MAYTVSGGTLNLTHSVSLTTKAACIANLETLYVMEVSSVTSDKKILIYNYLNTLYDCVRCCMRSVWCVSSDADYRSIDVALSAHNLTVNVPRCPDSPLIERTILITLCCCCLLC